MKKLHIVIASLFIAVALSACVKLGNQPVEKRYYRIIPERTAQMAPVHHHMVVKVRRATISDLYNTRELIYQQQNGIIQSDFYNLFFVTPANMITSELRSWLTAADMFDNIVLPGSMTVPDLTLETTVNALYGDFTGDTPVALVEMQFFLVDENTATNTIVFSKDYTCRKELDSADPQHLVQALTHCVEQIFTQLEADLAQTSFQ